MVNFLALEYRDDGGKPWRMGGLEHLVRLECTIHLVFVQSVIFVFFNQNADYLTKTHGCDIIIA